ncbi:hypothetical protein PoB_000727900 [Plakobranchus ocellatus]|uniref:PHD-type domain-containing protein n=1 Tax=Plakobranchus ocellatus TaxID=259542 RepID=A0AAV3YCL5_9GAST|nr:hypothetical protein PoB_000727900 [Plakobranchus ocellatus]
MRRISTSGVVVLPVFGCYARFPADFVDFVGDGCSTRNTSTLEILRYTFSIDKNATQNASWPGVEVNQRNKLEEEDVAASNSYPCILAVVVKQRKNGISHICNTWYHASCEDITDEEMRCWTSTDQEYLCRKCHGGFDKGIKRLEEISLTRKCVAGLLQTRSIYAGNVVGVSKSRSRALSLGANLTQQWKSELQSVASEFSSTWTILDLSQVLQNKVISVYPPENGPCDETVRILTTEFGSFQHELPLSILWMGPKKGKGKMWLPNHFLQIASESSDDAAAHDDEKQAEDGVCGGCDDDVLNDDGNFYEVD